MLKLRNSIAIDESPAALELLDKTEVIFDARKEPALELGAIYEAHASRVASWVARLAGPELDAEDLVHEVFLVVHKQLPKFRGESKLSTWLYSITYNVVRDRRRRERRRIFRTLLGGRQQHQSFVATPVDELEQKQATRLVYQVLDKLKETHRTALILFELEGLSGEEIAELLDISVNTVWVWLHRARAEFRQLLAKHHPAELQTLPPKKGHP